MLCGKERINTVGSVLLAVNFVVVSEFHGFLHCDIFVTIFFGRHPPRCREMVSYNVTYSRRDCFTYNKKNAEVDTIFSVGELNFWDVSVVTFVMFVFPQPHFYLISAIKVLLI